MGVTAAVVGRTIITPSKPAARPALEEKCGLVPFTDKAAGFDISIPASWRRLPGGGEVRLVAGRGSASILVRTASIGFRIGPENIRDARKLTDSLVRASRQAELLRQPKRRGRAAAAGPLRELGEDLQTKNPIVVKNGRFGPYVTDGEHNATLRREDSVEDITLERASELLADKRAKGPAPKRRATKKTGTTKKTAATKKTPAKKTPATKTAAKKAATKKAAARKA